MVGTYKDGMRDGEWAYWFENGQIRMRGNYKTAKGQPVDSLV